MARTQAPDYEQRRIAIMDKGVELFAKQGFSNVSVSSLAEACNISKSLIYHYFSSKEEILNGIMISYMDKLILMTEKIISGPGNSTELFRKLIHVFLHHYVETPAGLKVLFKERGNLPDNYRNIIDAKQRQILELTQSLILSLDTELSKDPARMRVQTMLLFGMINWTYTWYDPKGPIDIDQLADILVDMFTGAAKKGRKRTRK